MIGVLGELWNNGQILFCDRINAENYLKQSSEPSIIIRFADTDQGLIRVVIHDLNTRPLHHIAYYKPMVEGLNINPEDTFSTCEELKTIVFNYADVINALKGDKIKDPYTSKLLVRIAVNTRPNPIIIERFVDDPEWYTNKRGIKDAKINTVLARLSWRNV
uniref:Uncharacterized protein n=1 Tax=Acrobeloides nanus TaxID=290746 RepID=A0A914DAV9_9BILA